jgi:hypothetical protein
MHYMYYNFCRIHQTLRVTPAMKAGITGHVWSIEEIFSLLDRSARIAAKTAKPDRESGLSALTYALKPA